MASHFSLLAQRKVTKRKGTRLTADPEIAFYERRCGTRYAQTVLAQPFHKKQFQGGAQRDYLIVPSFGLFNS